jgi:hypothetical protein
VNHIGVEVEFATVPEKVVGVQAKAPPAPVASSPSQRPDPPVIAVQNEAQVEPVTLLKVRRPVTSRLVVVAWVVVERVASKLPGNLTWAGSERVQVRLADKSCAPADEVLCWTVPATVKVKVLATLLLKVVQSADERQPKTEPEEVSQSRSSSVRVRPSPAVRFVSADISKPEMVLPV